jgi:exonuclease SbcC
MRPVRLELEGFTAYREPTEIDFSDSDLFVLSGPTGAGKSTVIDAMSFALYGSVPRYQDPSLIHPVISQGKLEARVRFDFTVADVPYTAVRVVRRNNDRVSTKEARLESGERTLAGNVRELNEQVAELFGLTFEQFTTCVVLPQGEFARFLHERPAERQKLLRELLGMRLYERMRRLASERDQEGRSRIANLEGQRDATSHATPESRRTVRARIKDLEKLRKTLEREEKEIDRLDAERAALTERADRSEKHAAMLGRFSIPKGADKLAETASRLAEESAKARAALETAIREFDAADTARNELEDPAPLETAIAQRREETRLEVALREAETVREKARSEHEAATAEQEKAKAAVAEAQEAVEAVQRAHSAHALASHLHAGDPCPVCLRELEEKPNHRKPPGLATAQRGLDRVTKQLAGAEKTVEKTLKARSEGDATANALEDSLKQVTAKLRNVPSEPELIAALEACREATDVVERARKALDRARREETAARERVDRHTERANTAWAKLDAQRDALAELGPPPVDRDDLGGAWKSLAAWAESRGREELEAAKEARASAAELEQARDDRTEALVGICAELDVDVDGERPRDAAIRSIAADTARLDEIDEALEKNRRLRDELETAKADQAVARALALHLQASGFERWLLVEAFDRLVGAAGEKLRELSQGDYSFRADEKLSFDIIDHRNADEVRSVRTLSGGETFLASLALALSLADHVAEFAAEGAAPLDSMFLDEGFGTLDPDTLDVVATAIEELGARGRTIGLVTHVRELADRIPVQYRVTRGPSGSVIERVAS